MPLVLANRVQETGTANTTVSFTLTGAVTGFQSFAVIGNTNTTYYSATDGSGNWEVGLGTYSTTGPALARTTVYASSNSGSAVTFSGAVNVFVTYPSGRSVNLNESGNVSALGTVSSGVWQGSTVGVAYGGTGVTSSSGANSVVLRDANENITVNRLNQGLQTITASGGTTILTAASDFNQQLIGTGGQTFRLPDATTLTDTTTFQFNNNATGTLTIQNNAATTVGTVAPGGAAGIALMNNATSGGTWDVHGYIPENVTWGTNALALGSTVITGGTWQGGTITPAYGGTGLTSFTTNGAVYATGTTTLTSGTLPVISGGTGTTSVPTNGQLLIGNGSTYTVASLGTTTGISTTVGSGTLTINNTGVTSLAGTSPVTASASTGSVTVSLASGYGDTQNPYASKTANFFLAAPNGAAGAPTFRAVVAADIPTLNQNTTGSAGSVANAVTFNNGGTGDVSGTTFNGSAARTISYNTVGAPSTGGANATGTWGISISGNAATATTAANVNNGTLSMGVSGTGLSGSASFTANQSGNSTFTVTSNATNANTASTIVARDASGNFSAGTITATLSGSATSAGSVSNAVTFNNGGAGGASGSTFNGSGALTVSYNTVGAPSTTGTNASGTWGINISGNAATATSATSATTATNWGSYGAVPAAGTSFGNANTIGRSDASGYTYFGYINSSTGNNENPAISQFVVTNGVDNFYRKAGMSWVANAVQSAASGTWGINISGNAATATTASSASSVAWGNISSKPSNIMYYQGFTLDANTMDSNATGFTYSVNAPYTGPIARFSTGGGYDLWLNAIYNGGGYGLAFRTRNGDAGTFNSWQYPAVYGINANGGGALYATIYYDQNDTGYFVDPAGASNIVNLRTTDAVSNNINGLRNINPGGGSYVTSASTVSGAIRITLPQTVYPMIRFTVRVYTYDGLSFDIYCGGHTSSGYWYNTFAYMGTQNRSALNVRFTYGGGNMYVYIGELGSSWSYPQVFITEVQVGYSNYEYDRWDNGWAIAFDTSSYNNIVSTHTVYPPTSSSNNTNAAYASILYDANNTSYYLDPASTSELNKVYYNSNMVSRDYGIGQIGRYASNIYQAVWSMGESYLLPANGANTGNLYGIAWSYPGGQGGASNNLASHGMLILENGVFKGAWGGGSLRTPGDVRGTIFYDWDNTSYYLDPASTSRLNSTETDQSYTYGWFRNYSSNTGLYNQSTTQHLSSGANGYWDVSSTTSFSGIRFYTGSHVGSLRGYVYADTSNSIGFLNSGGTWRLRVVSDDYSLAEGTSMRAQLFYDSNNTAYYFDPTSSTSIRTLGEWRADTSGWTGEYAGKIQYHDNSWYLQFSTAMRFRNSGGSDVVTFSSGGNISASGTIAASSDERLKSNWRDLPANFVEQLAKVKAGVYDRVDVEGLTQIGVSAQSLQPFMPNAITQNADGMLGVAYGNAALVSAIKLAERVLQLEQRIKQLEGIA